jgi:hypothetical protein
MAVTRKNRTRKNESVQMGGKKVSGVGSRSQVLHGHKLRTAGGLTKKDLFLNKRGRIVSRKASAAGKKAIKRLRALGYIAKRGTFRLFKKADAKKTKKMRGGSPSAGFQDVQAKL